MSSNLLLMPLYNDNSQLYRSEYGHGQFGEGDMESRRRQGKLEETWKAGEGEMESWGRKHGKLGNGKLGKETWKVGKGEMESWRHGKLGKARWKVGVGNMKSWRRRPGKLEKARWKVMWCYRS